MRELWKFSLECGESFGADGLIHCLGDALQTVGIDNILDQASVLGVEGEPLLVGGGTDHASINVAEQNGMKGCFIKSFLGSTGYGAMPTPLSGHAKTPFSSQQFMDDNEMLLHLYYHFSKSPKKSRELTDTYSWGSQGNLDIFGWWRCSKPRTWQSLDYP